MNSTELEAVTVRIDVLGDSQNGGSGVIIGRQEQSHIILTAYHVVEEKRRYEVLIIDPNNQKILGKHIIENKDIKPIENYDLAEIRVQTSAIYPKAKIGDSDRLEKDIVTIMGYPLPSSGVSKRTYSPTNYEGKIAEILPLDALRKKDGATIKIASLSETGMSGGPVFNKEGELVGILSEGNKDGQTGEKSSSLAVPINLYPESQAIRKSQLSAIIKLTFRTSKK